MHNPGVASRRFYRVFRRWSLLNDPHAAGQAGVRSCRHDFHTSAPTRGDQEDLATQNAPVGEEYATGRGGDRSAGDQNPPVRFHITKSPSKPLSSRAKGRWKDGAERIASTRDGIVNVSTQADASTKTVKIDKVWEPKHSDCPKKFIQGEIFSATAKPFNTLKSGETVVRYRSDLGLMIEYAIRSDYLERLLKRYGPNLNGLSKKHGARVEVQNLSAAIPSVDAGGIAGLRTISVLISGSFAEVGSLYNHLQSRPLLRIGHELVKSVLQRPSHTLHPLEYVLRHRSDVTWTLEFSLLESDFMRFIAAHDITRIAARHNVSIDIGEPEQRSISEVSDEKDIARSFVITGSPQDVSNTFSHIKGDVVELNAKLTRASMPSNERRDRALKRSQPSERIDGDTKATAKNTLEHPVSSAVLDKPDAVEETLLVTAEGPRQAKIIRSFIGNGLELEQLKKDLGLQRLGLRKVDGEIGLLVDGRPAADRLRDKLHEFIQATISKAGCVEHPVKIRAAPKFRPKVLVRERELSREEEAKLREEQAKLSEDVRMVSRALTHPVVHISAGDPLAEQDGEFGKARGLTVSSFNTITLAPEPIISFNIKVPSSTWDAIYASQKLRVAFLSATPRAAAIAHAFAQPYEHPSEPFEKVFNARLITHGGMMLPLFPRLWDNIGGAILANISARLLPEKCVQIGDHIVVVAKVHACTFSEASQSANAADKFKMGLSYSMQSYRSAGETIEPAELTGQALQPAVSVQSDTIRQEHVEDELDPLDLASNVGLEHHGQAEGHNLSGPTPHEASFSPLGQDGQDSDDDLLYHALSLTSDASKDEKFIDIYEEFSKVSDLPAEDVDPQQEDEYDFGFDRPRHARIENLGASKRPYSPFATLPSLNNRRFYSTTSKATDLSYVLEPTTSHTTLSDYLCLPDDRRPYAPRVRGLIKRKSEIDTARARLTSSEELLEASEISELENLITTNERIIAKRLAWNATVDLRFMLDKGRYDVWFFSRVGWFESTIERGQAVLLEEAKVLKSLLEQGKVGRERYDVLAEKLKGDFEVMRTETRRLARVFEENGEAGDD